MRELTEEETQSISGGTRDGASQVTPLSQNLLGPTFGVHQGGSALFQPMQDLDLRGDIDAMIMES